MKLIIVAAGRGKRMRHLTDIQPKPLIKIAGKSLLQHKLDILPREITGIVIVVGYLGHMIRAELGASYKGLPIEYVEQKELLGNAHSLMLAKDFLQEKFLFLTGDDIFGAQDLQRLVQHDWAMLIKKVPSMVRGGKVIFGQNGELADIVEGEAHDGKEGYVWTGAAILTPDIFNYDIVKIPGREEFGLPQTIVSAVKKGKNVALEEATFWEQATDPEDIARLDALLSPLP